MSKCLFISILSDPIKNGYAFRAGNGPTCAYHYRQITVPLDLIASVQIVIKGFSYASWWTQGINCLSLDNLATADMKLRLLSTHTAMKSIFLILFAELGLQKLLTIN